MKNQLNELNKEYREELIKMFDNIADLSNKAQTIIEPLKREQNFQSREMLFSNMLTVTCIQITDTIGALIEQLEMGVDTTYETIVEMGKDPNTLNDKCIRTIVNHHLEQHKDILLDVREFLDDILQHK